MKTKSNAKKDSKLGMPYGTANGRLKKMILFNLLKKHNENFCFRCKKEIESEETLSIEHKIPWLNNEVSLFWDLNNIAFSHLKCNIADNKNPNKGKLKHPSSHAYDKHGCRCTECIKLHSDKMKKYHYNIKIKSLDSSGGRAQVL